MKHKIKSILVLLVFISLNCFATDQYPDEIIYEKQKCELEASWEYPSPLEVYFIDSKQKYPFEMLSTANYRGHIAKWELVNDQLFLNEVWVNEKRIDLKTIFQKSKDKVKAFWFNGVAWVFTGKYKEIYENEGYGYNYKSYVFLNFKNGNVINKVTLTPTKYNELVEEYFKRRKTKNPVKEGPIFEYAKYIHSFRDSVTEK